MKLSTRSRYGTRILVELAMNQDNGPLQISEISRRQKISVKYCEQLIRPLKKANLVNSVRGPKGGHVLSKNPQKITLGEIVRLFEGQTDLVHCISSPEDCSRASNQQLWCYLGFHKVLWWLPAKPIEPDNLRLWGNLPGS